MASMNQYGNTAFTGVRPYKGRDLESEMTETIAKANFKSEFNLENKRTLKEYDGSGPFKAHTEMFLVIDSDILLKYIVSLAQNTFNSMTVSADSYKIKGKYIGDVNTFECAIELSKKDDQTMCVTFNRKSGEAVEFYKMIDEKFKQPINSILAKVNNEKKE